MTTEDERLLSLASNLRVAGRNAEAVVAYRRLLAIRPELADSWYNLGLLLKDEARFEEALAAYDEALTRGVDVPEEVRLARVLVLAEHLRRETEAEEELRRIVQEVPDYVPARLNLGNLLEERGELEAASECYERILPPDGGAVGPHHDLRCEALARLVHLRPPGSLSDPLVQRLSRMAGAPAMIDLRIRANLNYALGRALDAIGEHDRAFSAFNEANRCVRRAGPPYHRSGIVRTVDSLIEAFPARIAGNPQAHAPQPVFICGMFRSGSTLVEQALAAHPGVTAGGELNLLNRLTDVTLAPYPQSMRALGEERARALAADYVAELARRFPESAQPGRIVTDKRSDNFLRIGLIKRLFPDAKIVHTMRDPIDTCLSVYFQHIDQRLVGYASDLADAGHYFGEYRRMMAHWKALYLDDIFDFDYDSFVHEPKPRLAELLEFLDLPWDERCLEFHKLRNPVKTASYWQVRRPLYKESSGRARHYDKHLAPLRVALAEAGVKAN